MTIHNIDALIQPATIALIGVTGAPRCPGTVMARNLFHGGFRGPIMPVSADHVAVEGVLAYRTVAALPVAPDLAVVCSPLEKAPDLIEQLGARGARAVILTSDGSEGGAQPTQALRQRLSDAAAPYRLRLLGPGSQGLMVPARGLNASLIQSRPAKGDIALIGQCGTVVGAVVEWAGERGIGFSHVAALGDHVDVDAGDLMDYLASDGGVRAILLHIEAVTSSRRFMSAARAAARHKPVIVIKAGRSLEATCRASARVGAPPGSDEVYDAAFRRAGVLRVNRLSELFDAVQTLGTGVSFSGIPAGPGRLAIVTNGNGIAVLATDTLIDGGGRLAGLSADTVQKLNQGLPPSWSHGNPVNIGSDATPKRYADALEVLLADSTNDAVLVLSAASATSDAAATAQAVIEVTKRQPHGRHRPVLTSWLGEGTADEPRRLFALNRIPSYDTPDGAIRGFLQLIEFHRNQELLMETPPSVPDQFQVDEAAARTIIERALAEGQRWLGETEALAVLSHYGIEIGETRRVTTPEDAAEAAREIGKPVALKLRSPGLSHRPDFNDVVLTLRSPDEVRQAALRLLSQAAAMDPPITVDAFTVQAMAELAEAQELMIGMSEDRLFGPVLRFGQGGTGGEALGDEALALPPLNINLAHDLMARTRVWRLMRGYRGRKAVDLDAVAQALIKVSHLVADFPEIAELEVDPLFASHRGVLALGARIRIETPAQPGTTRLAIQPYPKQLEETASLRDGTPVLVRPIRPEDEPALHAMIAAMTPEDLRLRFFAPTRRLSHHTAARMTQIDYDREMAFLLITPDHLGAEILGVVHLIADPDLKRAEFAPMVRSSLTHRGLGTLLMGKIISYARQRGIGEVYAEVLRENVGMVKLANHYRFSRHDNPDEPGVLEVRLRLDGPAPPRP
ncbi:MAG: bifunctional acetate--CoA ligase family protein/GNAT family N-acetyltransferase [Rhodospirillaceae bacterium]